MQPTMINIYIDNLFVMVSSLTDKEKALFEGCFTFNDSSEAFAKGTFDGKKVKKVKLFTVKKGTLLFFSGFLREVLELCKKNKLSVKIFDKRTKVDIPKENLRSYFPESFSYTQHQEDALEAMLKTHCGIIKAPTSSGKSSIIIAYLKITKMPALLIVNKVDLAIQLYGNLKDAGLDVGICTGKQFVENKIMVSTIFSVKKIPNLHLFPLVIVDESHHVSSSEYQSLFKKEKFPFKFGFSATPNSGDSFKWALIRQHLGSIIYSIDAKSLMDKKVIAKPIIQFITHECRLSSWETSYKINVVCNEERNDMIKKIVMENQIPTLIIVRYIEHGEILQELLPEARFLSGQTSGEERKKAIDEFEEGTLKIIIATSIFNEGISINAIQLLIIASAGKSTIEVAQRLGRSLRIDPKRGKYSVKVFDFMDVGNKYTERHSMQRVNIYKKSGFKVLLP